MNVLNYPHAAASPSSSIERAIAEEGAAKVLFAALSALLKWPARPLNANDLPDHLKRDVGLIDPDIANPARRRP